MASWSPTKKQFIRRNLETNWWFCEGNGFKFQTGRFLLKDEPRVFAELWQWHNGQTDQTFAASSIAPENMRLGFVSVSGSSKRECCAHEHRRAFSKPPWRAVLHQLSGRLKSKATQALSLGLRLCSKKQLFADKKKSADKLFDVWTTAECRGAFLAVFGWPFEANLDSWSFSH